MLVFAFSSSAEEDDEDDERFCLCFFSLPSFLCLRFFSFPSCEWPFITWVRSSPATLNRPGVRMHPSARASSISSGAAEFRSSYKRD